MKKKSAAAVMVFLFLIYSCLFITISACGDGPRAVSGGYGRKYNHTLDRRIPFRRHNNTDGGRTVRDSSGRFGNKYFNPNDSKIAVQASNTAASNNCSIPSSNSTSTDSPRSASTMIRQHTLALSITLSAIVLLMY